MADSPNPEKQISDIPVTPSGGTPSVESLHALGQIAEDHLDRHPAVPDQPLKPQSTGPRPSDKKPNVDRFIAIIGIAFGAILFILQANGVEMNWEFSLASYFVIAALCAWSCLRHAVPHLGKKGRRISAATIVAIVAIFGLIGTSKQYRREHPLATPAPQVASGEKKNEGPGTAKTNEGIFPPEGTIPSQLHGNNAPSTVTPNQPRSSNTSRTAWP
jgi:hypothetical protein